LALFTTLIARRIQIDPECFTVDILGSRDITNHTHTTMFLTFNIQFASDDQYK